MKRELVAHLAKVGRRGGLASSPAKTAAARRNALKRWCKTETVPPIPLTHLEDGQWYSGEGRNNNVGFWDGQAQCFWTIAINDFADPLAYPAISERIVRLKKEEHWEVGGTFKPFVRMLTK